MSNLINRTAGKNMHFYDIHFKPLHQSKCCGVLVNNRDDANIFVFEDKYISTNKTLGHALMEFFGGLCHV